MKRGHEEDDENPCNQEAYPGQEECIPLFVGRPERDNRIGAEDIINIKIALGRSNDINEFLKLV